MNLIVTLKPPEASRSLPANGETRPSREQLVAIANESAARLRACMRQIQSAVPGAEVRPLTNLYALILSCPPSADLAAVREQVRRACSEVEEVAADFRVSAASPGLEVPPGHLAAGHRRGE